MRILAYFLFATLLACSETQSPAAQQNLLPEMAIGHKDAPVIIIEYASMTCSHCAQFHKQTYPLLKKDYINTGKVRLIFREYPLDPWATAASMLARCVSRSRDNSGGEKFNPQRFFAFLSVLFHQQPQWVLAQDRMSALKGLARHAGIGEKDFTACFNDEKILNGLHASRVAGTEMGVQSTPSFFINDTLIQGNQPYPVLRSAIEKAFEKATQ